MQGEVGLHELPLVAHLPEVASGQSASTKQAALMQWLLLLSQVSWLHFPAWGAQSALTAQLAVSTLQVELVQSLSDEQLLLEIAQVPTASPPRQLFPSLQSTPTSVEFENEPPGTPVSEPEVSSTISMLGLWICRLMISSGSTRASARGASSMPIVVAIAPSKPR